MKSKYLSPVCESSVLPSRHNDPDINFQLVSGIDIDYAKQGFYFEINNVINKFAKKRIYAKT
jgi:hypothetical protein